MYRGYFAGDLDRIYGTETEFGLYQVAATAAECWNKNFAKRVCNIDQPYSSEFFFFNGGLFKPDNSKNDGFTPEYATPECRSVRDAVCWEKAGEIIMAGLYNLNGSNKGKIVLTKHGRGSGMGPFPLTDETAGHHENYSYDDELEPFFGEDNNQYSVFMISFLVSRMLFSGSGWFKVMGSDIVHQLSPRVDFIEKTISASTTGSRPILCSKREPHSCCGLSRLHLIVGDHLMSEPALYLTLGSTGLILRILENHLRNKKEIENIQKLFIRNPLAAIHRFNLDACFKTRVELAEPGKDIGILDLSCRFCDIAEEFIENNQSTDEERDIVCYWRSVLDRLRLDIYQLDGELDWVTKLGVMAAYLRTRGVNVSDFREIGGVSQISGKCDVKKFLDLDLAYHFITEDGIYNRLKKAGRIKRIVSDEEVSRAITNPPGNTRAKIRGEQARLIADKKISGSVHWVQVNLTLPDIISDKDTKSRLSLNMNDPFDFLYEPWQNFKTSMNLK